MMNEHRRDPSPSRRGFLGRLAAVAAVFGTSSLSPSSVGAESPAPDDGWITALKGRKHRQFFESGDVSNGRGLHRAIAWLDAYHDAYGMTDADLGMALGFFSAGLAIVFNDDVWARHKLGERQSTNDPLTKQPATRNPFIKQLPEHNWPADYSIEAVQKRGVKILGCGTSLRNLATALAGPGGDARTMRDYLSANVLPGVTIVPGMLIAAGRAQEAGFAYVRD